MKILFDVSLCCFFAFGCNQAQQLNSSPRITQNLRSKDKFNLLLHQESNPKQQTRVNVWSNSEPKFLINSLRSRKQPSKKSLVVQLAAHTQVMHPVALLEVCSWEEQAFNLVENLNCRLKALHQFFFFSSNLDETFFCFLFSRHLLNLGDLFSSRAHIRGALFPTSSVTPVNKSCVLYRLLSVIASLISYMLH